MADNLPTCSCVNKNYPAVNTSLADLSFTGTLKRVLTGHTSHVWSLAVFQNGDLISGSNDKTMSIWNPNDGTLKRTLLGHTDCIYTIGYLQNGDLVTGSGDQTIKIWSYF